MQFLFPPPSAILMMKPTLHKSGELPAETWAGAAKQNENRRE